MSWPASRQRKPCGVEIGQNGFRDEGGFEWRFADRSLFGLFQRLQSETSISWTLPYAYAFTSFYIHHGASRNGVEPNTASQVL